MVICNGVNEKLLKTGTVFSSSCVDHNILTFSCLENFKSLQTDKYFVFIHLTDGTIFLQNHYCWDQYFSGKWLSFEIPYIIFIICFLGYGWEVSFFFLLLFSLYFFIICFGKKFLCMPFIFLYCVLNIIIYVFIFF